MEFNDRSTRRRDMSGNDDTVHEADRWCEHESHRQLTA